MEPTHKVQRWVLLKLKVNFRTHQKYSFRAPHNKKDLCRLWVLYLIVQGKRARSCWAVVGKKEGGLLPRNPGDENFQSTNSPGFKKMKKTDKLNHNILILPSYVSHFPESDKILSGTLRRSRTNKHLFSPGSPQPPPPLHTTKEFFSQFFRL